MQLDKNFQQIDTLLTHLKSQTFYYTLSTKIDAVIRQNPDYFILKQIASNNITNADINKK